MSTSKKCNVFKRLVYSFIPSKYGLLSYQSQRSTFGFMAIVSLIISLSIASNFLVAMEQTLDKTMGVRTLSEVVEKFVPEFTIENGVLDLEEPFNYTIDTVCVYIDSSVDELTLSDIDYLLKNTGFSQMIIGSAKNLFVYEKRSEKLHMYNFSEVFKQTYVKSDLVVFIDKWTSFGVALPIMTFILLLVYGVIYAALALLFGIVFVLLNLFLKQNVRVGKAYAVAVYALIPSFVLAQIVSWLPVTVISEIAVPIYILITVILGCFGMYSVHDMAALENEEKYKYNFEQNPYRISGIAPANTEMMSDEALGGYAAVDTEKPSYQTVNGNVKVRMKGIEVEYSELELINKYIKGNLKDLAVQQLGEVTGLNINDCRDVIDDWNRYYY